MTLADTASIPKILTRDDGTTIAYHRTPAATSLPGAIFLTGFKSDMTGGKARALEAFCRDRGQAFLRFDYRGHGASSGRFEDGGIGDWADDAIAALDALTAGPQILIGSSMGGWIMLLVALARPDRVAGLVGIASAPDYTEDLMWARFPAEVRAQLTQQGVWHAPSRYDDGPYVITRRLIEDGRRHLVLRAPLRISCPVRLLHGMADPDVPWQTSQRLLDRLGSADATLTLIKDAGHRLNEPPHIARIQTALAELSALLRTSS